MLPAECGARVGAAEKARPGSGTRKEKVRRRFPQSAGLASVRRKRRDRDRGGRKEEVRRCFPPSAGLASVRRKRRDRDRRRAEGGGSQMLPAECGARVGAAEEARLGSEARNEEVRSRFPQSTRLASVRRKRRDRDRRRGMKRSADASRKVRGSRRCGGRGETGIGGAE